MVASAIRETWGGCGGSCAGVGGGGGVGGGDGGIGGGVEMGGDGGGVVGNQTNGVAGLFLFLPAVDYCPCGAAGQFSGQLDLSSDRSAT